MKSNGHHVAKVDDILNQWGFVSNPYYDHELLPDILFDLFVDRETSIEEFYKSMKLNTSMFCIEGDYGVGKSSFFGRCALGQEQNDESNIITNKITITKDTTEASFLLTVLSAVVNSLKGVSDLSLKSQEKLTEIENIVTIQRQQNTAASLYGFVGHSRTTGKSEQHSPKYTNLNMLSDLSEIGDICKSDLDKKVILPIDDLESEKCDLEQALYLVGLLRDLIFTDNYVVICIGEPGLREKLSSSGRTRSIFGESITLNELSFNDFKQAIEKRLKYFSNNNYIPPFDEAVYKKVHEISYGDIRWAFNTLNRIFEVLIRKNYIVRTYGISHVLPVLHEIEYKAFSSLESNEQKLLSVLSRKGPLSPSDKEFQDAMGSDRVTIQKLVQKLSEDSSLLRKKKVSRKYIYEVGPIIKSLENSNLLKTN
ncbi:MAG TPA: P-loop NTPase fold protein [Candidatus Methanoperedens sp.]